MLGSAKLGQTLPVMQKLFSNCSGITGDRYYIIKISALAKSAKSVLSVLRRERIDNPFMEGRMRSAAIFATITTTLMTATAALAQQGTGFYVGAGAGINLLQDNNLNIDNYDVGPAGNIYGGYDWGSLRADFEEIGRAHV